MDLTSSFTPDDLIFAYTRVDALRDGVLVELPGDLLREAGIRVPVAVTRSVWEYLCPADLDELPGQSVDGRTWDLLWMFARAASRSRHTSTVLFRVAFLMTGEDPDGPGFPFTGGSGERLVALKATCGPGDEGEPVITIMLPGED